MRRWLPLVFLVSAAAFAGDGTPPTPAAPKAASVADPVKAVLAKCRYEPCAFEMTVQAPVKFGEKVLFEKLEFPSPVKSADAEKNDVVKAKLFRTEKPEPAAVVFLGGWRYDPATPALAARFAGETGIQALYIELPFQGERTPKGRRSGEVTFSADLAQDEATFVQAAQDVERAVEWLVRERKVDAKRLGILGTSLGGFVAGDLYGMTDRFACAVLQISGGDVASVVFGESNWLTKHIREGLAAQGLDEAAVRERMRPLDPATWARKERKDGLLLIAAEHDEIVPLATVKSLAESYGGARLVVMPDSTHINPKGLDAHFPEAMKHFVAKLVPAKK